MSALARTLSSIWNRFQPISGMCAYMRCSSIHYLYYTTTKLCRNTRFSSRTSFHSICRFVHCLFMVPNMENKIKQKFKNIRGGENNIWVTNFVLDASSSIFARVSINVNHMKSRFIHSMSLMDEGTLRVDNVTCLPYWNWMHYTGANRFWRPLNDKLKEKYVTEIKRNKHFSSFNRLYHMTLFPSVFFCFLFFEKSIKIANNYENEQTISVPKKKLEKITQQMERIGYFEIFISSSMAMEFYAGLNRERCC